MTDGLITRDKALEALRPFAESGDPANVDDGNPEAKQAYELVDAWEQQMAAAIKGDSEAELRYEFERTTLEVDAGFADTNYIDEVANDWLAQTLTTAEDGGFDRLAEEIQAKINELNAKLK